MQQVLVRLTENGYEGRIVSVKRLRELQREIRRLDRRGLLNEELYRDYLAGIVNESEAPAETRSVIVAAVPQPQVCVKFTWEGAVVPLIIPPTYLWARRIDEQVRRVVAEALEPAGHWSVVAAVPKKVLAVRSGLAAYGRNNLSYVPGMGSFHRLVALYSDLPCDDDMWKPAQMLSRCETCSACVRRCPSGAITTERFLLHAERCITYHSEKDSRVAFPTWFQAAWQNCLVGCMRCQTICPENTSFINWVEDGPAFSQEETGLLLSGRHVEQLPSEMAHKLRQSEMEDFLEAVPRNLRSCLEQVAR
jgi:epoxyqueuosine reductase